MRRWSLLAGLLLAVLLTACAGGDQPESLSDADRLATRVAEDQAVASTLTAAAGGALPSPTQAEGATQVPLSTPTSAPTTEAAPTATVPQGDTTALPTATLPPPTATTEPPPQFANIVFNPEAPTFGGSVILPGAPSQQLDNPTFNNDLVFQVIAYFPPSANQDGEGINTVVFRVEDPNGNEVHRTTEENAGYCMFGGGNPACDGWRFSANSCRWPGGQPVRSGQHMGYALLNGVDGSEEWRWRFQIDLDATPCAPLSLQFGNIPFLPDPSVRSVGGGVQMATTDFGSDNTPIATDPLLLRAVAYLPKEQNPDGSPIMARDGNGLQNGSVLFTVFGPDGTQVYQHTERFAPYCLFNGDSNTTCDPIWQFSQNNCRWPTSDLTGQSSRVAQEGEHQVEITISDASGQIETWSTNFILEFSNSSPCA